MIKYSFSFLVCTGIVACGPSRQAAWEKSPPQASASNTLNTPTDNTLTQAETAWEQRENRASLEKAISLWETLTQANPQDVGSLTSLSRAYYFLADNHMRMQNQEEQMLGTFEKGVLAGERALMALSPSFSEAVQNGTKVETALQSMPSTGQAPMYWYAANLGKFAVTKGFTTSLFYKERIFNVMKRVLEIDETFYHGAPHRYFGAYYAKAPAFAGGDLAKSKEHFERALQIAPDYLATKVMYAEFYATKTEDKNLFTDLLKQVEKSPAESLADLVPEQRFEQQKAAKLLNKTNELF